MASAVEKNIAPFKNIDLEVLRSAAVVLVVINHLPMLFAWHPFPIGKYFLGYGGVDIFFAISGYIITLSLLNSLKKKQRTSTILKSFWTKRVFRILPMAYTWIIIPIILSFAFNATGGFGNTLNLIRDGVASITQTANFHWSECFSAESRHLCGFGSMGQTPLAQHWSLSTEEQFYIIFPLLLLFVTRKWLTIGLAALPILFILVDRRVDLFIFRFDAIAVGVLIAFAQTQKWYKEYYPSFLEKRGVGITLLAALLLLVGLVPALQLYSFTQTIIVIIAAMLVFIASFNANFFTRSLPWLRPFFLWMGDRSYGIYLIHVPAFIIAQEVYFRMIGTWDSNAKFYIPIMAAMFIFILVEVCGALIERPLRNIGRNIAKNIENKESEKPSTSKVTQIAKNPAS